MGKIYQVNVKPETTGERGMPKKPVEETYLRFTGLDNDYNKFRTEKKNSDKNKAVMLLPLETIIILNSEGWPVMPGDIGENLTTMGMLNSEFKEGDIYRIGNDSVIQISEPCTPCKNLSILPYIGKGKVKEFMQTLNGRRGWYATVFSEGRIKTKDFIFKK
jgi:MOSC domain-containing protein YiiM